MVDSCAYIILFWASLILSLSNCNTSPVDFRPKPHQLVQNLDDVGEKLTAAVRAVDNLRRYMVRQIDVCRFSQMDCSVKDIESLEDFLQSLSSSYHNNPGKRSLPDTSSSAIDRYLDDIYRKELLFGQLQSALLDMLGTVQNERKRSCKLNLGGHCQTQEYAAIANMNRFFQSGISPGKK